LLWWLLFLSWQPWWVSNSCRNCAVSFTLFEPATLNVTSHVRRNELSLQSILQSCREICLYFKIFLIRVFWNGNVYQNLRTLTDTLHEDIHSIQAHNSKYLSEWKTLNRSCRTN
jgi:hypothetical protein